MIREKKEKIRIIDPTIIESPPKNNAAPFTQAFPIFISVDGVLLD